MAHLTVSVEYGLHCLLWLADPRERPVSRRDLAEMQGISPSFVAKIFAKLEKAGIVTASEGVHGGYRIARPAAEISVLQVVDAIEGKKPLFDCQEIRGRCAVFEGDAPPWATGGVCAVHAVILQAEKAMRDALARQSLADIGARVSRNAPAAFGDAVSGWFDRRLERRGRPAGTLPGEGDRDDRR